MLNRAEIAARVRHAGAMCLLERVSAWDASHIACEADVDPAGHPLARDGGVPAIAAVEFAAQATAVHGALLEPVGRPRGGMLAKLNHVELTPGPLSGRLAVRAELLSRSGAGCMYAFTVHDTRGCRARGHLLVALHDAR